MRPDTVAYLGLGSNLGDRAAQLRFALERLAATPGVRVTAVSSFRTTEPVGGPPQPRFLNAAARVATSLDAHALLAVCRAIEREAGRRDGGPRDGPRELDLDILLFGEVDDHDTIDTRDLIVPHPRMGEREFVLEPLRELGVDTATFRVASRPFVDRDPQVFAARCADWRRGACQVGLVPTMGALHAGHAELLRLARAECDRVAATIFVNPLQFAVGEDLARYPRPFEADLALCAREGVDVVFAPAPEAIYGPGFASCVAVGREAETMEGASRPGHFVGVATVVARLWSLALPERGYFGEKDAQQLAVLRRLHGDLGLCGAIRPCGIVREPDGLAMSSRNVYLAPDDRRAGTVLVTALRAVCGAFADGERDRDRLVTLARDTLAAEPRARTDYVELRAVDDLAPLAPGPIPAGRLLVAARFGEPATRLLDNAILGMPAP